MLLECIGMYAQGGWFGFGLGRIRVLSVCGDTCAFVVEVEHISLLACVKFVHST